MAAAQPTTDAAASHRDVTFRNYSTDQAATYAKGRTGYSPQLIKYIVEHHKATGGSTHRLLDVGCGPGTAVNVLAPSFDVATGADPGEAMIETARQLAGTTGSGAPVQFVVSTAEEIDSIEGLEHGSVDLITAATAAHWFDMSKFWPAAAKLLKPGGSAMFWIRYSPDAQDAATPGGAKLRALLKHFDEGIFKPYITEGSQLARSGYATLGMPWDYDAETAALFDRDQFLRHEIAADPKIAFAMAKATGRTTVQGIRAVMETMGSVTRWREDNPELVGTPQDCLNLFMVDAEKILADLDDEQQVEALVSIFVTAVICVKRKKE